MHFRVCGQEGYTETRPAGRKRPAVVWLTKVFSFLSILLSFLCVRFYTVDEQGMASMTKSLSVVVMPTHLLPVRPTATAPGTMSAYFDQIEVSTVSLNPSAPLESFLVVDVFFHLINEQPSP